MASTAQALTASNVVPVKLGNANGNDGMEISVQICVPGTTQCNTISHAWLQLPLSDIPVCADAPPYLCPATPLTYSLKLHSGAYGGDWDMNSILLGTPFFPGRKIYYALLGMDTPLGTGPWVGF